MNVVIRVDASHTIGSGHVMRSLTLAEGLRRKGAAVSFVCREHEGNLIGLISSRGYFVVNLPAPKTDLRSEVESSQTAWLGVNWQSDAEQTCSAIRVLGPKPDWLVIDHYGIDERWEAYLRRSVTRIFAIDDLADRRHDCELLLDQNLVENYQSRYAGNVSRRCALMLGPRYALLQPIYAQLHDRVPPREGAIKRILVFFGGADRGNLAGLALKAVLNLQRPDIEIDLVVTGNCENAKSLRMMSAGHHNIHVHTDLPSLAPLIARADIAVGAAGSSSWERLSLGLPALVITMAENQRAIAESLHRRKLVKWLGHEGQVGLAQMQEALLAEIEQGANAASSIQCREAVDARGLDRVVAAMLLNAKAALTVRHAVLGDEALLLEWANDPTTRANSFNGATIRPEEHRQWFFQKLRDLDACHLFIIETADGVPVGQVRFEKEGDAWKINYSIAAPYRGKALGCRVLKLALRKLQSIEEKPPLVARVTPTNMPSHKVFRALGFVAVPEPSGIVEYRLAY